MSLNIYLGQPIDRAARSATVTALVDQAKFALWEAGHNVYEPARAFSLRDGAEPTPWVQQVNDTALEEADGMLAIWPDGVASVGLPLEISRASELGLPVALVCDTRSQALATLPGVRQYGPEQIGDAVSWLREGQQDRDRDRDRYQVKVAGPGEFTQGYWGDAGYDLHYHGDTPICIEPGAVADIPAGVAVEWPCGMWGFLVGRSSSFRNRGLLVNPAIIDHGFRGDLFAIVRNISDELQWVKPGERIAQIIPLPTYSIGLDVLRCDVDELSPSERGTQGFGSTGK